MHASARQRALFPYVRKSALCLKYQELCESLFQRTRDKASCTCCCQEHDSDYNQRMEVELYIDKRRDDHDYQ